MKNVIFADFNNRDVDGFIRLNTVGTTDDLSRESIILEDGLKMVVSDGDIRAEVIVRSPGVEGIWRAEIASELEYL